MRVDEMIIGVCYFTEGREVILRYGDVWEPRCRTVSSSMLKHVLYGALWYLTLNPPFAPGGIFFFFSPRSLLAAGKFSRAGLFYWAASRHRLCLYWPVSRCALGREGVSPDLPTGLGVDWSAQLGWCRRGVHRGVEDLRQGCGGWNGLQTEGWQRRKRLLHG